MVSVWPGYVSAGFRYVSAGAGELVKLGAGAVDSEAFAALALFP